MMKMSRRERLVSATLPARMLRELGPALLELLWYLGAPVAWLYQLMRLTLFVTVMLPKFLPPTWNYLRSPSRQCAQYGPSVRHCLDIYLPLDSDGKLLSAGTGQSAATKGCPVVIFVTGGAWIIGYRMWAFLLCPALQRCGILCFSVDYRKCARSLHIALSRHNSLGRVQPAR